VVGLGYPVGFLAVILGSQQLYTENTLTPIVPLMTERTVEMLRKVLVLWSVVFAANMIGTLLFAWAIARTDVLTPELAAAAAEVARESTSGSVGNLVSRTLSSVLPNHSISPQEVSEAMLMHCSAISFQRSPVIPLAACCSWRR
jgi:formate/nitrite transporter FocA (FNT family)